MRPIFSIVGPSIFFSFKRNSQDQTQCRIKYDLVLKNSQQKSHVGREFINNKTDY